MTTRETAMCSACSGDPEDPPEGGPVLDEEDASPFWAWWREDAEDEVESVAIRLPFHVSAARAQEPRGQI